MKLVASYVASPPEPHRLPAPTGHLRMSEPALRPSRAAWRADIHAISCGERHVDGHRPVARKWSIDRSVARTRSTQTICSDFPGPPAERYQFVDKRLLRKGCGGLSVGFWGERSRLVGAER